MRKLSRIFKVVFALLFQILICLSFSAAGTDLTNQDIERAIDIKNLKHPYLYFTDEEKPEIIKRIANNSECGKIMARLLAEANRLLYMPVDRDIPVEGKNPSADWS